MSGSFVAEQRAYWGEVDAGHYGWQTEGPYFAETEAALLGEAHCEAGERFLEVGCGEGGNLFHLARRGARMVGTDFSLPKVGFARRTGAWTACADAAALPFVDGAFDALLVRDLLHHVADRRAVLAEAHRVLRPGGRLTVIEPNGRSPLVLLQAALVAAERGVLRSTLERLEDEVGGAGFVVERATRRQPLPLARLLLHPRFGLGALGGRPLVARLLDGAHHLAAASVPEPLWTYLVCQGRRP